jgi:hypothetical protein
MKCEIPAACSVSRSVFAVTSTLSVGLRYTFGQVIEPLDDVAAVIRALPGQLRPGAAPGIRHLAVDLARSAVRETLRAEG